MSGPQDAGRVTSSPGSRASTEPVPVSAASGFDPSRGVPFSYAGYTHVVASLAAQLARESANTAYGMWNPHFCAADASAQALRFFGSIRREIEHWERHIRDSDRSGEAGETGTGSIEDESAGRNGIAQS